MRRSWIVVRYWFIKLRAVLTEKKPGKIFSKGSRGLIIFGVLAIFLGVSYYGFLEMLQADYDGRMFENIVKLILLIFTMVIIALRFVWGLTSALKSMDTWKHLTNLPFTYSDKYFIGLVSEITQIGRLFIPLSIITLISSGAVAGYSWRMIIVTFAGLAMLLVLYSTFMTFMILLSLLYLRKVEDARYVVLAIMVLIFLIVPTISYLYYDTIIESSILDFLPSSWPIVMASAVSDGGLFGLTAKLAFVVLGLSAAFGIVAKVVSVNKSFVLPLTLIYGMFTER